MRISRQKRCTGVFLIEIRCKKCRSTYLLKLDSGKIRVGAEDRDTKVFTQSALIEQPGLRVEIGSRIVRAQLGQLKWLYKARWKFFW